MHRDKSLQLDHQHLKILFHLFQGDVLLHDMKQGTTKGKNSFCGISKECYTHFALSDFKNYSHSELEHMWGDLEHRIHLSSSLKPREQERTIFHFMAQVAENMFALEGNTPICKFEYTLAFRNLSLFLGQDILTTSFLAYQDYETHFQRQDFYWPGAISTNNNRLKALFSKGISENHFHLNGSVPMFFLSWICLMNEPYQISQMFASDTIKKQLTQSLSSKTPYYTGSQPLTLEEKVKMSCYIRGMLFQRLHTEVPFTSQQLNHFQSSFSRRAEANALIAQLRLCFGQATRQKEILDYAISSKCVPTKLHMDHHNRLYFGERWFLYRCFYNIFQGKFSAFEKNAFYLYLLFQNNFYSELIQVNGLCGFENFLKYQDRKDMFFHEIPKYKKEAQRFALYSTQKDQNIRSFEARITFQEDPVLLKKTINDLDQGYEDAKCKDTDQTQHLKHFYVLHFIKGISPLEEKDDYRPRNHKQREKAQKQSRALEQALRQSPPLRSRILGIDACSQEIGCRPETFATEFRFLRHSTHYMHRNFHQPTAVKDHLSLRSTYHVGEDFLDMLDGLRAIDETLYFLDFQRGDRLGHALALGLDPSSYYESKNYMSLLPKQDLLDNLVWFLFRALDYQVSIPSLLQQRFSQQAEDLLMELYGNQITYSKNPYLLSQYYKSWKLRGDHPAPYQFVTNTDTLSRNIYEAIYLSGDEYKKNQFLKDSSLDNYRKDLQIIEFYREYHYNHQIKKQGQQQERFIADPEFINVLQQIQTQMQKQLMTKGIGIECNLSSNVLISTFRQYEKHPVFRFNQYGLQKNTDEIQIQVSINTDDLGVFGTSLENEYALLASAMLSAKNKQGQPQYQQEEVYQYLEHLRELGNMQSFLTVEQ